MSRKLDAVQARILGSLVEKSLTTPELYPLTLNSLINACNQKSSRDPVMDLDEAGVGQSLHALLGMGLAERVHEPGSRVPKFRHRIDLLVGTEDAKTIGAVCVLLLRGPQTPGEIKGRTERLVRFESTAEVETLLGQLGERGQVARLPRSAGQKESRFRHLFCEDAIVEAAWRGGARSPERDVPPSAEGADRLGELEARMAALEAAVKALQGRA